jgi:hypothetical protein
LPGQQLLGALDGVEVEPLIAGRGDQATLGHRGGDRLGGDQVDRQRLLDKEGETGIDRGPLRRPMANGGTQT